MNSTADKFFRNVLGGQDLATPVRVLSRSGYRYVAYWHLEQTKHEPYHLISSVGFADDMNQNKWWNREQAPKHVLPLPGPLLQGHV